MADPTTDNSTSSITPTLSTTTPARTGEQENAPLSATSTAVASGVDHTWTGIGPAGDSGGGSASSSSDGGQNAIKFILPVIGVLIGIFFLICVFIYRQSYIKRRQAALRASNDEWLGSTAVLAEELASGVRTPNGSRRHGALSGAAEGSVDGPGDRHSDRARRYHRRVRGLRRQESGATIRTLPEYSKEAGDEEVVLVRRISKSSIASSTSHPPSDTPRNAYRRPSVAELISGGVATAVRRTTSLLSMSSSANTHTHAHAHAHAHASTHSHASPSRSSSAAGHASASTPEPLHLHLQGSGYAHASALGHMPPVMETMQTAALMDSEEGDRGDGGNEAGQGMRRRDNAGEASPRSSTSSSSTITPLQLPAPSADLDAAAGRSTLHTHAHASGSRPAPPYHPTRTNTCLSAGILRGDAPTYLEAMSTPDLTSEAYASAGVPAPAQPRQTMRGRTSETFRNLLHRTHLIPSRSPPGASSGLLPLHLRNASGSSTLLLRPISSHTPSVPPSPRTPGHGRGPGPNRHSNNPYRHSLANSSFHTPRNSSYSLVIGSPIPSTAVRAGFNLEDLPRAGLSEDQMRFLASSEAVDLVGVRMDGPVDPVTS